ncbi:FkbM family methyltransferase [Agrobacterium tumefaciens]|uniref:FkbM family methyltransferase n=1 Tax=Agrobacterium tumefaciens TaxID=358 RepID=UPI0015717811|nr:FkbM family methyltransferase [Agrobacterium tumefaciens]NSX92640.1 FkbM family methyltransferase [Agrobacterium tumefaciens]NSX92701.1 FkbM family methyltransferase [Agrobacterium tumefaciens]
MKPITRLIYESLTPQAYSFDVFFDIGANVGQTCRLAVEVFPEARVLSFEPVASTYATLVENNKSLKRPVETFDIAFGEENGTVELFLKELSVHHTLLPSRNKPLDRAGNASEIIKVRRLSDFAAEQGIDFIDILKIDVEGYEIGVLKGGDSLLSGNVAFVIAECNFAIRDERNTYFPKLERYLTERGFEVVGLYDVVYRERDGRLEYCDAVFVNPAAIKAKGKAHSSTPASGLTWRSELLDLAREIEKPNAETTKLISKALTLIAENS